MNYFYVVRELSEEEKQMIILSEDFQRFMDRTGRIIERALSENVDIYMDYACMGDGEDGAYVFIIIIIINTRKSLL